MNRSIIAALAALIVVFALVFAVTGKASGEPGGNNGTLKIHEQGTPDGTESNDPKVCTFNVEGFGFDAGQVLSLVGEVQGGDAPVGEAFTIPDVTADAAGAFASAYVTPKDGHYKVTAYGKSTPNGPTEEKAKSKVFKVECEPVTPPPPTPTETETPQPPTETPTVTPPTLTETPSVTPPVTPTETPTVTPETPTETPEPPKDETPVKPPKQTPQPPKDVQVIACVDGVWVTTVNGEVISESGTCNVTPENSVPQTFSETGL